MQKKNPNNNAYLCATLKRKKMALKTEEKYPLIICMTLNNKSPCILYVTKISRAIFNKRCLKDSVFLTIKTQCALERTVEKNFINVIFNDGLSTDRISFAVIISAHHKGRF